ncbi:multi-sensor signal transduction histidine kinase [Alcanivorax xiamenensis]|uniref:Multi-sensor signal transduction histidine kinase n=1 Tax=Alcanivorax xiamenensis TaxID=1177156 RepID=A0ABQ6Y478_9GAMM|nr:PAS domain S-box protein [Alcanivorax xiamenensis]KAF0804006.1 multi-sensor signal transduction histidine kinase [Alcanivorax xiamenensis]
MVSAPTSTPSAQPDFESLVQAAGDIIYTLDRDGRFTFCNRAMEEVLGYHRDELLGQHFGVLLTPATAPVASQGRRIAPFFEVEALHRDGGKVHLEVRAASLIRDGQVVGRQGIARDISELKALQAQVQEKSRRMALLDERTRIAAALYSRLTELLYGDEDQGEPSGTVFGEVEDTLSRLSAARHGLGEQDLKILNLLAAGHSNGEIAEYICRSPHTVKDHVRRIMQRLGAKRRTDAVARALKLGLITRA